MTTASDRSAVQDQGFSDEQRQYLEGCLAAILARRGEAAARPAFLLFPLILLFLQGICSG